jgi:hypothetical protein
VCFTLFFVASGAKSRQFVSFIFLPCGAKAQQTVTPFALGRYAYLLFPAGLWGTTSHKKKCLHAGYGHLFPCGGRVWPCPYFFPALHPRGAPPRPHARHGGAGADASVALRVSRKFQCYWSRYYRLCERSFACDSCASKKSSSRSLPFFFIPRAPCVWG